MTRHSIDHAIVRKTLAAAVLGVAGVTAASPAVADVYVTGSHDGVLRFDDHGAFLGRFDHGGGMGAGQGIAFGPGRDLYVASAGQVLRFDGETGSFIGPFASGADIFPDGLTFGPDGHLYVANRNLGVYRFDGTTGVFIDEFTRGHVPNARHLTFGPGRHLYVSAQEDDAVLRYDGETGEFIDTFASGGGLARPDGLAFGPDGHLYVTSIYTAQVLRFDGESGAFMNVVVSGLSFPFDLKFGGVFGALYIADDVWVTVARFDCPTGTFINNAASGNGLSEPRRFTLDPPPPACPGDIDLNGAVEFADIIRVLQDWGPCP